MTACVAQNWLCLVPKRLIYRILPPKEKVSLASISWEMGKQKNSKEINVENQAKLSFQSANYYPPTQYWALTLCMAVSRTFVPIFVCFFLVCL